MTLHLSAIADEASADFAEQIRALREERIPYIELRGLDGKNVSELTDAEAERYAAMLKEGGIRVWSIGSPLGKIGIKDDFEAHLRKAERVFRIAHIFGTEKVRVFSFFTDTPEKDEEKVIARMKKMQGLAENCGVRLYHENEKHIFGDTAARCDALLRRVPGLGCVFDPANFVQCNEDVSSALALLRERVDYYHIKDALFAGGEVVPAGCGDGQIGELVGGIAGDTVLTLEPHLSVFEGYAQIDATQLKNKFSYPSQRAAFAAAAEALRCVLKDKGFCEEGEKWIK